MSPTTYAPAKTAPLLPRISLSTPILFPILSATPSSSNVAKTRRDPSLARRAEPWIPWRFPLVWWARAPPVAQRPVRRRPLQLQRQARALKVTPCEERWTWVRCSAPWLLRELWFSLIGEMGAKSRPRVKVSSAVEVRCTFELAWAALLDVPFFLPLMHAKHNPAFRARLEGVLWFGLGCSPNGHNRLMDRGRKLSLFISVTEHWARCWLFFCFCFCTYRNRV